MRTVHPVNVGVEEGLGPVASGHWVATAVYERFQGEDLNGDGDRDDRVMEVYDARTRKLINVGLGFEGGWLPPLGDDFLAFTTAESELGKDVDGDGLQASDVVAVLDLRTDTTVILPMASTRPLVAAARSLAFVRAPGTQLFVYDLDSGILHPLGPPGSIPYADGKRLLVDVWEMAEGRDLNGDGDMNDPVLGVYDPRNATLENTGFAIVPLAIEGDWVAFAQSEREEGVDLNGDGDVYDWVMGLYNVADGRFLNTGLGVHFGIQPTEISLAGGILWVAVSEITQGLQDLNGDGDAADEVLFAYDPRFQKVVNSGAAVPFGFEAYGDVAAFRQEVRGRSHLEVFDLERRTLRDLGPGVSHFVAGSGYVCYTRDEQALGDLNGDGDAIDYVSFVYERARGQVVNTGLATSFWDLPGKDWIVLPVIEYQQNEDLDGDGKMVSMVNVLYNVHTRRLVNTAIASSLPHYIGLSSQVFAFRAEEGRAGRDLNGDGDLGDEVLQVISLRPLGGAPAYRPYR